MAKFSFLTGDCDWLTYGGMWISNKLSTGAFDYWLVIRLENLEELGADDEGLKYMVSLLAVSPHLLTEDTRQSIQDQFDPEWWDGLNPEHVNDIWVEECVQYGASGQIWYDLGNNYKELMTAAKQAAQNVEKYPWSYFDQTANALGSTVLDFMAGDPLSGLSGSVRSSGSHQPAVQSVAIIMQKNE
jgi:hypothetical protein